MYKHYLSSFLLLFTGYCATAQQDADSKFYEIFDNIVGIENTGLFNGTEFVDPYLKTDGTFRYFDQFNFTKGNITYSGQFYPNVLLKYDVLEDQVITRSDDNLSIFQVKLIPEKISNFSVYGHNFVRLSLNETEEGNGFFEIGFNGEVYSLYVKHIKKMREKALNSGIEYSFKNDNFYLLKYENGYKKIGTIKDLRNALPKKNEQIRDFYKTYKTLYKANRDEFMIKIVKYLDGLDKITNNPKN